MTWMLQKRKLHNQRKNMKLTNNFTLEELVRTSKKIDNTPSEAVVEALRELCINVLQPARDAFPKNVFTINSGFRSPAVNKAVGGAANSDHLYGFAADVSLGKKELNKMLFEWIKKNRKFTQLINEYDYSWVHVSYNKKNLKCQLVEVK